MQVALYARVSTTRQADNDLSIPDQLRQMRDWATANGHLVVQEFVEPGASATDDKRPVFQQMIGDALMKPPAFEVIITLTTWPLVQVALVNVLLAVAAPWLTPLICH